MFKIKIIFGVFVIITALAISAFNWTAIAGTNESINGNHKDFRSLDEIAGSVAASAMTRFYAAQALQRGLPGDLTTLDSSEISAYRWNAMADFYANLSSGLAGDLTTLDSAEISAYRWNARADFFAKLNGTQNLRQIYLSSPGR